MYHYWQYHQPLSIILWVKTFSHTPYGVSKFAGKTFSSDLRKLTAVSKSLSLQKLNILLLRNHLIHDTFMYQTKLAAIISEDLMKQSIEFIKDHRESRHKTVMERQIKKYNKLWAQKYESGSNSTYSSNGTGGRSNQDKIGAKFWVVNLSHQPLSQAQEAILAHRPNFAVTPKTPLQRLHNSSRGGMPKP